ncbi:DUF4177 domain-containing protein [Clostridium sporogenes]|uniref:DUF4177 domain-containing protein n=1 Tax=Clostridium sporogenes TaxID=1509 RepID=UPI002149FD7B|nr:DUF4177 domain-containing protein [Clostridium sporogenes]MCR1975461.1 DUF4177 domain-containing protein [Clostridium sporogenes]
MVGFEYTALVVELKDINDGNSLTNLLNLHGKNGWELVFTTPQPCLGSSQYALIGITQKMFLIFKRQLQ